MHAPSSPSMDISKASNFERFVFDLVGSRRARWRDCGAPVERRRLRTVRTRRWRRRRVRFRVGKEHARGPHGDDPGRVGNATASSSTRTPPTASRSGSEHRERGVPLICLETALPDKFAATIRGARPGRANTGGRTRESSATAALRRAPTRRRYGQGLHRRARGADQSRPGAADSIPKLTHPCLRDLGRNIAWVRRSRLGLPVTRLDFRVGVPQLLALFVFSALVDIGVDWVQRDPDAIFTIQGLVGEMFFGAILVLLATLLARAFRQPGTRSRCRSSCSPASGRCRSRAPCWQRPTVSCFGEAVHGQWFVTLWMVFWLWRASAVSLSPPAPHYWLRSVAAAVVLISPMWLFAPPLLPEAAWWMAPSSGARDTRYPCLLLFSEKKMYSPLQPQLLDDALSDLEDQRPALPICIWLASAPTRRKMSPQGHRGCAGTIRPAIRHRGALGDADQQSTYGARRASGDRQQPARR